jgi:hypothetical protein
MHPEAAEFIPSSTRAHITARELALISRTSAFELALTGSPRSSVEYDYVGKQSIPATRLSPANPTATCPARHHFPRWGFGSGQDVSPRSRSERIGRKGEVLL